MTSTSTERRDFVCVHCNHQRTAMVVGIGTGSGHSPFFLDNGGARGRAQDSAFGAARENAYYAVSGAVCPKCGKTNRAVRLRVFAISLAIGLLLGGLVLIGALAATEGSRTGMWLGAIGCVAIAAGVTFTRVAKTFPAVFWEPETPAATAPKS